MAAVMDCAATCPTKRSSINILRTDRLEEKENQQNSMPVARHFIHGQMRSAYVGTEKPPVVPSMQAMTIKTVGDHEATDPKYREVIDDYSGAISPYFYPHESQICNACRSHFTRKPAPTLRLRFHPLLNPLHQVRFLTRKAQPLISADSLEVRYRSLAQCSVTDGLVQVTQGHAAAGSFLWCCP